MMQMLNFVILNIRSIFVWQVLLLFSALLFRNHILFKKLAILLTINNVKTVLGNNKILLSSVSFAVLIQTLRFVPKMINLIYNISTMKNLNTR
jgi:hypothetical protein